MTVKEAVDLFRYHQKSNLKQRLLVLRLQMTALQAARELLAAVCFRKPPK